MIGHPLKIQELLEEVIRGEILLPEFQRAYVWKPTQVVRLIDSIYRDYPTGQILLWDTTAIPITRQLDGVEPTGFPTVGRPKIVLDGQQRLTSLYKALSSKAAEPVEVWFNLDTEEFRLYRKSLSKDPCWVPVREIVDQRRHDLDILREIAAAGGPSLEDPACRDYLERLRRIRRIGEYAFPIEIFRSDDFEEVTELFVRANSGGTRLRQAELVLAQLVLRLPGNVAVRFEEAIRAYQEDGFALDARFLVRAIVAVGTGQSRFKNLKELWSRDPDELDAIWQRTSDALEQVVHFVRTQARFHDSSWVPSLNALIPLVVLFDRGESLKDVGLLRWFYLVSLRGRYSASAESAMDADLRAALGPRPLVELLTLAMDAAGSLEIDPEEFEDAEWRNPLFPLTYALARKRGARDLFSGALLGALKPGQAVVVHPIFPKAALRKARVPSKARNEIANLVFLNEAPGKAAAKKLPSELFPEIDAQDPNRLIGQAIPLNRDLWVPERYVDFLAARRELLAEGVNDLLDDPV